METFSFSLETLEFLASYICRDLITCGISRRGPDRSRVAIEMTTAELRLEILLSNEATRQAHTHAHTQRTKINPLYANKCKEESTSASNTCVNTHTLKQAATQPLFSVLPGPLTRKQAAGEAPPPPPPPPLLLRRARTFSTALLACQWQLLGQRS